MLVIFISIFSLNTIAAESETHFEEIKIPEVLVTGQATFETLRNNSFVPTKRVSLDISRGSTVEALSYSSNFPSQNYGYPAGANAVNLGGRSSTDTQVTTLGIPLNLAQGGGSDISSLPSFLWKNAILSPSLNSAGFTPSAASGSIEFLPWTREMLFDESSRGEDSRLTASYDRQVQTFSLATKKENIAMLAGMTNGLQTGPAGELSYYFYHSSNSQLIAHVIGTDQKGDLPSFSAQAKKHAWRILPVLESKQKLSDGTTLESTFFADIGKLTTTDPVHSYNESDTRTEQYGVENALISGATTFALSGRYVQFTDAVHNSLHENPIFGSVTEDVSLSDSVNLKATANSVYANGTGISPGAKISMKFSRNENNYPFLELNTTPKLPTLIDRFATYPGTPTYHGNPNLNSERVNTVLAGYQYKTKAFTSKTTAKLEYRNSIIVSTADYSSEKNAGNARLASLEQENKIIPLSWLNFQSNLLFTTSKLNDTGFAYPDVPGFSARERVSFAPSDSLQLDSGMRFMGPSTTSGGGFHKPYTFFDETITYYFEHGFSLSAGLVDIFDQRSEIVVGYPTVGRMVTASLQAQF